MSTLKQFNEYLEEQVRNHSIYVWGGQGQTTPTITEEWIRKKEQTAERARDAINFWKAQVKAGYGAVLRAFDCSGLAMYFLQNIHKLYPSDKSANSLMNTCTRITRSELQTGDWVFRIYLSGTDKGKAYHIGYVVDSALNVIEARGRTSGVVKKHLNEKGTSYWNAYGRPTIFEQAEIVVKEEPVTYNTLRKGIQGDQVKYLQTLLIEKGCALPKFGADGDFGSETDNAVREFQSANNLTVDGIVGPKTWAKLLK